MWLPWTAIVHQCLVHTQLLSPQPLRLQQQIPTRRQVNFALCTCCHLLNTAWYLLCMLCAVHLHSVCCVVKLFWLKIDLALQNALYIGNLKCSCLLQPVTVTRCQVSLHLTPAQFPPLAAQTVYISASNRTRLMLAVRPSPWLPHPVPRRYVELGKVSRVTNAASNGTVMSSDYHRPSISCKTACSCKVLLVWILVYL